jgi:hypothetical protein
MVHNLKNQNQRSSETRSRRLRRVNANVNAIMDCIVKWEGTDAEFDDMMAKVQYQRSKHTKDNVQEKEDSPKEKKAPL